MGNQPLSKKGRPLSIKRPNSPTEPTTEAVHAPASTSPIQAAAATGGITLASANVETDPFRKSITDAGYIILDENEYGVVARMDKGKPTFIPKTKQGFDKDEKEVRCSTVIPEHIDTALKVRAAKLRMSTAQYLTQLIVADLRIYEDL